MKSELTFTFPDPHIVPSTAGCLEKHDSFSSEYRQYKLEQIVAEVN